MTVEVGKAAELRAKHLEMLQTVIARISGQGATLKNYCLTLITAVCGFAITLKHPSVVLLSLLPVTIFWLLDARYLAVEWQFRSQFDRVRTESWDTPTSFEMVSKDADDESFSRALFSWSIGVFYIPLALGIVIVALIARCFYGKWF